MGDVVADISISLDGYVTGPDPDPAHGLGAEPGSEIHTWAMAGDAVDRDILDSTAAATGAVLMGRRLFDVVDGPDGWNDEVGYGAVRDQSQAPPVVVVTSEVPEKVRLTGRFTFVTDGLEAAVGRARELAGGRDVVVMGGAELVRTALRAGLVDVLRIHLSPVLVGDGTPLFVPGEPGPQLEQLTVRVSGSATHLTYRVAAR